MKAFGDRFRGKWGCGVRDWLPLVSVGLLLCVSPTPVGAQNQSQSEEAVGFANLHEIGNEPLIAAAFQVAKPPFDTFLAELRGLDQVADALKRATEESSTAVPDPNSTPDSAASEGASEDPLGVAAANLAAATSELNTAKRAAGRLGALKELYAEYLRRLQAADTAANILFKSFEDLAPFSLELHLRREDQTLQSSAIPDFLNRINVNSRKRQAEREIPVIAAKHDTAERELTRVSERVEAALETVRLAEGTVVEMEAIHASVLKQQNLEQEFVDKTVEELVGELARSIEELTWLNGTYNLSHGKLQRIQSEIETTDAELMDLAAVTPGDWDEAAPVGDVDGLDAALGSLERRLALLESSRLNRNAFVGGEESFRSDDSVLREHLFRLRVLTTVLEGMASEQAQDQPPITIPQPAVPVATHDQRLQENRVRVGEELAEAVLRLEAIDGEIESARESLDRLMRIKERWERERELVAQAEELDSELQDLDATALLARFASTSEATAAKIEALEVAQEEFDVLRDQEQGLASQYQAQPDPFSPLIAKEVKDVYEATRGRLSALAEIDAGGSASSGAGNDAVSGLVPVRAIAQDIGEFRQTLSTQQKNLEERGQTKTDWLSALEALRAKAATVISLHTELQTLTLGRYVVAVELKKRLGRQELASEAIPPGLTEALQRERIQEFERQGNAITETERLLGEKITLVRQPDTTGVERIEKLADILSTLGKRSDLASDQEKLVRTVAEGEAALSATQLKTRKQEAIRRLEAGTSLLENVLSFVPSNRAQGLWELMQDHYQETLELEDNQANLQSQSAITEKLLESITEEQTAVQALLALERSRLGSLVASREESEQQAQDQLRSVGKASLGGPAGAAVEEAEGERGATLETVDVLARGIMLKHEAELLCGKWIELLEERLSLRGLAAELAQYQQDLGTIQLQSTSNERRLAFLRGSVEPADSPAPEEATQSEGAETAIRQAGGEIHVLRQERLAILEKEVVWALGRMVAIVVGASVLLFLVGRISRYRLKKAEERNASAHTFFVLSFFSTVLKISIWIVAILLLFSVLGFQVGTILAGLGIGGLAVAMAARETLANILGGIMIFFEKPFSIGDVIKIGPNTARVIGMTWRTTRLQTPFGYSICVPNSQATESMIKNFSHTDPPGDYFMVYISARHDPQKVIPIMNKAIADSKTVLKDQPLGTWVAEASQMGNMTVMAYWPWWSIEDYGKRNGTRNEVWQSLWKHLKAAGIEMEVHPFQTEGSEPFLRGAQQSLAAAPADG